MNNNNPFKNGNKTVNMNLIIQVKNKFNLCRSEPVKTGK